MQNSKAFRTRVAARLATLGISMRDASIRAGMNPDTLGKFLTGKTGSLRADNMAALARVLDVNESWLMGSSEASGLEALPFGVPFGGTVEAGAFRAQDALDQDSERERIAIPHDHRFPPEAQYAFRVVGDSMNKANIQEGMVVLALEVHAWARINGEPRDGALVVVARQRNGGPERELTIKRLRIGSTAMRLEPESTNPRHKPISFALPRQGDETGEGDQAQIVAVCLQAIWLLA
jgi:SOS-response transcriptional repressor LexA